MKLGISSYSLYQAMQTDGMTILEAIDWIAVPAGHMSKSCRWVSI